MVNGYGFDCYNLKQLQKYFNLTSSFVYTNSGFYNNLAFCQLSQKIGNFLIINSFIYSFLNTCYKNNFERIKLRLIQSVRALKFMPGNKMIECWNFTKNEKLALA